MPTFSIMFIAGDPSGDQHASHVLRRLSAVLPDARCIGIGGPAMRSCGFTGLMPFEEFNRMGLWEVLVHLPFFLKAKKKLIDAMDLYKPKALVCVDYPGLNIPLMKEAAKRAIPVVWYIVPQVWAWKKKRAALLGAYASFIGVIFPFEVDFFKAFRAAVSFVGHPLIEALAERSGGKETAFSIGPHNPFRLSLLPGSRLQEVTVMLPIMMRAALILKQTYPDCVISVSHSRNLPEAIYRKWCEEKGLVELFDGPLRDLLDRTDGAFVTSGTATLETALAQVPMVIVYRTSPITYWLLKSMIRIPFIGLPNIVAGEKIVPECIQEEATGVRLAEEMNTFISSRDYYANTVDKLCRLRNLFGDRRPSVEVAEAIASFIKK